MMPCLRCGSEYGLFKKESYCRNCGFSFCSGCLPKKIAIPKLGTEAKHSVCSKCYGLISSGQSEINANSAPRKASPPAALQKRMDLLANQNRSNVSGTANGTGRHGKDGAIALRLENLRAERQQGPIPSLSQLEERLAKLKSTGAETPIQVSSIAYKPDTRTATEQTQDLLDQVTEAVEIDSRLPNPDDDISRRLAMLRNDDAALNDLNKPSANNVNVNPASSSLLSGSGLVRPTLNGTAFEVTDAPLDKEVLEVWQYMIEAEKQVCREAEEALKLQEKDLELKRKLEEIKANRDTTSKRLDGIRLSNGDTSDEDNEDKITDKVIHQFLNEDRMDNITKGSISSHRSETNRNFRHAKGRKERKMLNSSDNEDSDNLEELPWCAICNEDACLRCYGCDGDLYCRRCFRECHDSFDLREHPSSPYKTQRS